MVGDRQVGNRQLRYGGHAHGHGSRGEDADRGPAYQELEEGEQRGDVIQEPAFMRTMTAPAGYMSGYMESGSASLRVDTDAKAAEGVSADGLTESPVPKRRRPGFGQGLARLQSQEQAAILAASPSVGTRAAADAKASDAGTAPTRPSVEYQRHENDGQGVSSPKSTFARSLSVPAKSPKAIDNHTMSSLQKERLSARSEENLRGMHRSASLPSVSRDVEAIPFIASKEAKHLGTSSSSPHLQVAQDDHKIQLTAGITEKQLITPAMKRIIDTATQENARLSSLKMQVVEEVQEIDNEIGEIEDSLKELNDETESVSGESKSLKMLQDDISRIESLLEVEVSELVNAIRELPDISFVTAKLKQVQDIGIPLGSLTKKDRLRVLTRLSGKLKSRTNPSSKAAVRRFDRSVYPMVDDKGQLIDPDQISREHHLLSLYHANMEKADIANSALPQLELPIKMLEMCGSPYAEQLLAVAKKGGNCRLIQPEHALYLCPSQLQTFHDNVRSHSRFGTKVQEALKERMCKEQEHKRELAGEYVKLHREWSLWLSGKFHKGAHEKDGRGGGKGGQDAVGGKGGAKIERTPLRSSSRLGPSMSGIVRSEQELEECIEHLAQVEYLKKLIKIPDMLTEAEKRTVIFPSRNGLRTDPVADLERDRVVRPWTAEETEVFIEKYLEYPKDFRKISTFLEHRDTGDCVQFYYRFQKLKQLEPIRKKRMRQKMKMRLSEAKRISMPYLGNPPVIHDLANLGAPPPPRRAAEAATIANRNTIASNVRDSATKDVAKKEKGGKHSKQSTKKKEKPKDSVSTGPKGKGDKKGMPPQQRQQQTLRRAGKDGGSRTGNDNSDAEPKATGALAAQKGGDASDGTRDYPKTKTGESFSKFINEINQSANVVDVTGNNGVGSSMQSFAKLLGVDPSAAEARPEGGNDGKS